jgi:hypothetical protein
MRPQPPNSNDRNAQRYDRVKVIFKPLEDYMLSSFGDYNCLNTCFSTLRRPVAARRRSESAIKTPPSETVEPFLQSPIDLFSQLDAKTLLLGDFAENGDWWTGRVNRNTSDKSDKRGQHPSEIRISFLNGTTLYILPGLGGATELQTLGVSTSRRCTNISEVPSMLRRLTKISQKLACMLNEPC